MAPSTATEKHVLEIWTRINVKRSRVHIGRVKFTVRHQVQSARKKNRFANGSEHNYTDEIFRIVNTICMTPRPVYELEDLNGTLMKGQFYADELTPIYVT